MTAIGKAIRDLEDQKKRIDAALKILRGLSLNGEGAGRNLSPEGRKRIAEAQKRRWARERGTKK
ncbi:MAG: hypothetical protein ACRD01_12355 [Terriglobales bacterium]